MSEFKEGETVYLKSGSHPLTVRDVNSAMVAVSWENEEGLQVRMFPPVCLTHGKTWSGGVVVNVNVPAFERDA